MKLYSIAFEENCDITVGKMAHVNNGDDIRGDFLVKEIATDTSDYSSGIEVLIELDSEKQTEAWVDSTAVEF